MFVPDFVPFARDRGAPRRPASPLPPSESSESSEATEATEPDEPTGPAETPAEPRTAALAATAAPPPPPSDFEDVKTVVEEVYARLHEIGLFGASAEERVSEARVAAKMAEATKPAEAKARWTEAAEVMATEAGVRLAGGGAPLEAYLLAAMLHEAGARGRGAAVVATPAFAVPPQPQSPAAEGLFVWRGARAAEEARVRVQSVVLCADAAAYPILWAVCAPADGARVLAGLDDVAVFFAARAVGGDVLREPLPVGADVARTETGARVQKRLDDLAAPRRGRALAAAEPPPAAHPAQAASAGGRGAAALNAAAAHALAAARMQRAGALAAARIPAELAAWRFWRSEARAAGAAAGALAAVEALPTALAVGDAAGRGR